MITVKGIIHEEHFAVRLSSSTNEIIADEPISAGGKDKGFSPTELLASSLAACTSITVRMYADRKHWPLEKIEVTVELERNVAENITHINRVVQLFGNLTGEQRSRLLQVADHCPIHNILTNPINIKTSMV